MKHYLKLAIITTCCFTAFISDNSSAKSTELAPIQPRIVGGDVSPEGDWPWMSALVYTSNEISTTLTVDNTSYESQAFSGGITASATGNIVDCGIGDTQCSDATNKICLIERGGDIDFSVKVENCQAGGGVGAIIYNNKEGNINGTLGDDFTGIPAIAITQMDGITLQKNIGASANLTVIEGIALAQSSTCGASFLGDKWLLTASHCVEGVSPQQLKVNVGEYDLSNGAENAKAVKRIYMHADYQLNVELDNDIALIELVDSVNNPAITLVDLAATEQFTKDNRTVTVVGWGGRQGYPATGGSTSSFPDKLHQVDLQLLTNNQCKHILAQSSTEAFEGTYTANDIGITDAMICAFIPGGGKGSCQGDSGGPLMINTNEGWQQIGIVSWGIGCAADGFPGVYTRSALFTNWVNEITQGIAIDQSIDFTIQAQTQAQSVELDVVNNSELTANLTFAIDGATNFTITNDTCNSIAAGATCQLQLNYDAANVGKHNATIMIDSGSSDIATSSAKISAQTIALANTIKTQLSSYDNALTWYSGGSSAWQLDNTEAAIISGDITDNQESIVMVTVSGEGELSFEWSVSSEENIDDPETPYDALYLYVDGELINFISGDVAYKSETVKFNVGEHNIVWVYQKDPADPPEFTGDDNAHIRNVVFTPVKIVTPTLPAPTPTNPKARSSSGGGITWFSLLFIAVISLRRK
ncbi:MAG: serine protease [Colwellia sp.]|nr:MAG: serine protease [Colwellia sp.]